MNCVTQYFVKKKFVGGFITAMGILSIFFRVVAYVFNLFIPFWLFESSTDGKSKQVREPEEFSDSFSPFQDFETRTNFHEDYSYG